MAGRLVKNVTDDYLTCPICLNRFREPRTLPCEHTFCLQCLAAHIERTREEDHFTCPIDRKTIPIQNDKAVDPWALAAEYDADPVITEFLKVVHRSGRKVGRRNSDTLDFYCFGCKTLVTAEAAVDEHKESSCECMKIGKAFKKMLPSITSCNKDLEGLLLESQKMKKDKDERQGLTESQQEVLQQIEKFESKIENFFFNCKEQISVLKTQVLDYKTDEEEDDTITSPRVDEVYEDITDAYCELNSALDEENMLQLVSSFSNMKPKVEGLRKRLISVSSRSARSCSFEYVPNTRVQELLHKKVKIGTLHSIEHFNYRAGQTTDRGRCNLYDAAVTDKYIIISDGANDTLKRFLLDGTFVDNMTITNPCRITIINNSEIALTRFFKKKITIISLGRKMHVKDHIRTKRPYVGICYLDNERFATTYYDGDEPSGIDVIAKDGKIVHCLLANQNTYGNSALFVVPMFLAKTQNGKIVLCDYSETKHVLCFNDHLELLWRQTMDSVPCGVTCDIDTVYVTLPDENKLVALYQDDGEKLRNIIKPSDGVKRPYAVSANSGELVVTEDESDKIHILRL